MTVSDMPVERDVLELVARTSRTGGAYGTVRSCTATLSIFVPLQVCPTEKTQHNPTHPTHIHIIPPIQSNDCRPRLANVVPPPSWQVEHLSSFYLDLNRVSSRRWVYVGLQYR